MFLHVSVILFTGGVVVFQHALQQVSRGGVVSQLALQVSRPTPRGEVEGSGGPGGVSRPTPKGEVEGSSRGGLQAHTWGGLQAHTQGGRIPACTEADPPQRLLLRAVRILLECILVTKIRLHTV